MRQGDFSVVLGFEQILNRVLVERQFYLRLFQEDSLVIDDFDGFDGRCFFFLIEQTDCVGLSDVVFDGVAH